MSAPNGNGAVHRSGHRWCGGVPARDAVPARRHRLHALWSPAGARSHRKAQPATRPNHRSSRNTDPSPTRPIPVPRRSPTCSARLFDPELKIAVVDNCPRGVRAGRGSVLIRGRDQSASQHSRPNAACGVISNRSGSELEGDGRSGRRGGGLGRPPEHDRGRSPGSVPRPLRARNEQLVPRARAVRRLVLEEIKRRPGSGEVGEEGCRPGPEALAHPSAARPPEGVVRPSSSGCSSSPSTSCRSRSAPLRASSRAASSGCLRRSRGVRD